MIKFQRRRLPMYVCYCDDVPDYETEPPMLQFKDNDELFDYLNSLSNGAGGFRITDSGSVLCLGGCIG